jgi:hypothetical protein
MFSGSDANMWLKGLQFRIVDENGQVNTNTLSAISSARLVRDFDNEQVGSTVSVDLETGDITFLDLNYYIYKDTTHPIDLQLNLNNFGSEFNSNKFKIQVIYAAAIENSTGLSVNSITYNNIISPVWTLISNGALTLDLKTDSFNAPTGKAYVLAGMGQHVGELVLNSTGEDMVFDRLSLTNYGTATNLDIEKVQLIDASGQLLAETEFGQTVNFYNLNYTVPKYNYKSLFIHVKTREINESSTATSGRTAILKISGADAHGASSDNHFGLSPGGSTPTQYNYDAIDSTVELQIMGAVLNQVLNSKSNGVLFGGNQGLARYTFYFDNGNNLNPDGTELMAVLGDTLKISIHKSATVGLTDLYAYVVKLGTFSGETAKVNLDENDVATFDLTTLPNDYNFVDGTVDVFIIGNVETTSADGEYIKSEIDDLSKDFKWGDGTTTVIDSRLPYTSVQGPVLAE